MKKILLIVLAVAPMSFGCASYPTWADLGQMTDCGTTYYALENGYREGNPIFSDMSPGLICATKLAASQASKYTPEPMCKGAQVGLALAGFSAAAWNIGVIAGSGLYAIPVIIGVFYFGFDPFVKEAENTCRRDD